MGRTLDRPLDGGKAVRLTVSCFIFPPLASCLSCLNSIIRDTAITNPAVLTRDPRQETGSATWFHLAFLWALWAGV